MRDTRISRRNKLKSDINRTDIETSVGKNSGATASGLWPDQEPLSPDQGWDQLLGSTGLFFKGRRKCASREK